MLLFARFCICQYTAYGTVVWLATGAVKNMEHPSIFNLPELIATLPDDLHTICERLLFVERVYGTPVPPPSMQNWIIKRFGSLDRIREQTIVKITHLWTLETAFFNPLRAYRHQDMTAAADRSSIEQAQETAIATDLDAHRMFRDPLRQTTADPFGRIQGEYCISASNVAKCDGWHGLVIFDEPHPLRFNQAQLCDYFNVAVRWLATAHQADTSARYPLIIWNCLWKAGASITHGHLQMLLGRGMAAGQVERWRRAAVAYRQRYNRRLSEESGELHTALGLTFQQTEEVCGYVSLTPVTERELVLVCRNPLVAAGWSLRDPDAFYVALQPVWQATFAALRALIDRQGVRSFNVAVYMPPCVTTSEAWTEMPLYVRIVDRGDLLSHLTSIGALEMFVGGVITVDPFAIAAGIPQT